MTDDTLRLNVEFRRAPVRGLDAHDTAAARAWVKAEVEAQVSVLGKLPPGLRYLRESSQEVCLLDKLVEVGQESILAAFFRSAGEREGIVRRFREGEILVKDDEEGAMRRAAAVMELVPGEGDEQDGWWVAWRYFGEGEAGVGNFFGPWHDEEGRGVDELDEHFVEWFDDTKTEITGRDYSEGPPVVPEDFNLRMAVLEPPGWLPEHPGQIAVAIGRSMDTEVLSQGLTCFIIFALDAGCTQLERYEVRGGLPCDIEDIVRNIAGLGDTHAVVLVSPGTITQDDGTHRAVHTIAEVAGHDRRVRRILPVSFGADGRPIPRPEIIQERVVEEGEGWIGVEPSIDLGMHPLGMVDGLAQGEVPEG